MLHQLGASSGIALIFIFQKLISGGHLPLLSLLFHLPLPFFLPLLLQTS